MAGVDIKAAGDAAKAVGDAVKALGPTDETRKEFAQTFLGSVIGQTVALVGLLVTYAAFVVLAWKYAREDLAEIQAQFGQTWLLVGISLPFVAILLFTALPTALRARRERRLKKLAVASEGVVKPGYFRLHPYGAADSESFHRLDGAERDVLAWIEGATASLLYLSGASGVGKSSVLAAYVAPRLRKAGWAVVEMRIFGDPVERLREALTGAADVLPRGTPKDAAPRDLLERAARRRKDLPPLLIVVDQFEEFLILHEEGVRAAFKALLDDLVARPIDGVRLLLTFRSDYQGLVFKLGLPAPNGRANWWELSPWSRAESELFLRG